MASEGALKRLGNHGRCRKLRLSVSFHRKQGVIGVQRVVVNHVQVFDVAPLADLNGAFVSRMTPADLAGLVLCRGVLAVVRERVGTLRKSGKPLDHVVVVLHIGGKNKTLAIGVETECQRRIRVVQREARDLHFADAETRFRIYRMEVLDR